MGQGYYTVLGWGAVLPDTWDQTAQDAYEDLELDDALDPLRIRQTYEATPEALYIAVAVDDPFLRAEKGLPDLPYAEIRGHAARRTVVALPPEPLVSLDRVALTAKWETFRALLADYGVTIPEGGPLLIADWD